MHPGALDGIKALEICSFVAGPYCGKLLADMGADVIKVEPPDGGDVARSRGPFFNGSPGQDNSFLFIYLNNNKRGITLDVSSAKGREILHRLLSQVDMVIEDLPLAQAEAAGMDPASLREEFPSLVCTSITPFGRSGPYKDYKAYYLNNYHSGGDGWMLPGGRLADRLYPDREPIKIGGYIGEYQVGLGAALASVAAILSRTMDGEGRHVDVSAQEILINLNAADFCQWPDRGYIEDRRHRHLYQYIGGLYKCKDGYWEMLLPAQRQWEGLLRVMGDPEWAKEEKYADHDSRIARRFEIDDLVEDWAMNHTRDEIYHWLQTEGCAAGPVYTMEEMLADPQMEHRGFYADMAHPVLGNYRAPGSPGLFSETPSVNRSPAPQLGQHNMDVYGGLLGYEPGQIVRLKQTGVI